MTPENMQILLERLNSMTPENMKKLLDLLNSMTPENMKKLLDLLNSMTPENMKKLLYLLNSMTPENMGIMLDSLGDINKENKNNPNIPSKIGELLEYHSKLDEKSMSKLLDFYSFIEIKQMKAPSDTYEIIFHKYKDGKTPFFKSISIGKEDPSICKAIETLDKVKQLFFEYFKDRFKIKKGVGTTTYDPKLSESDQKCKNQSISVVRGGRSRRKL
jgi:hypothetical protein